MNSPRNHQPQSAGQAEETLRLIAGLPAPENLASRIQAGLHSASRTAPRNASLLHWPISLTRNNWMQSTAMRSAAAAAIVCVVAGGGWRIYSRVQPPAAPTAKVTAMPAPAVTDRVYGLLGLSLAPDAIATPYGVGSNNEYGNNTGNERQDPDPTDANRRLTDFSGRLALRVVAGGVRLPTEAINSEAAK